MYAHPETDNEARIIEAEARLQPRRTRVIVVCHRCGQNYVAGMGHHESDWCRVAEAQRRWAGRGMTVVHSGVLGIAADAGVRVVQDIGGFAYSYGSYKLAKAESRPYVPKWFAKVVGATQYMQRPRRVLLLRVLQDQRFRLARAFIAERGTAWLELPIANIRKARLRAPHYPWSRMMDEVAGAWGHVLVTPPMWQSKSQEERALREQLRCEDYTDTV